jgi:hypothetical protein
VESVNEEEAVRSWLHVGPAPPTREERVNYVANNLLLHDVPQKLLVRRRAVCRVV